VLIVDDPDAPDPAAPRTTFVHWVVYNLPSAVSGLPEGAEAAVLPPGARVGANDWRKAAYGGPCPPIGRHRYFFKLYALDVALPDGGAATKASVVEAMRGHVLAEAQLMGTYEKQR
jgi:Raf kinase inhibitor-like YbhB/YbcL family protein